MGLTAKKRQPLDTIFKEKGYTDSCCFCKECSGDRQICKEPRMARPAPEAMAVDVYSTVRQYGFPINVRTDYDQKMDRYAFLMVH